MSNIPAARKRINSLVTYVANNPDALEADQILAELIDIEGMLHRKPPVRKAGAQSQTMTPELAASIRAFAIRNEGMTFQAIGQRFNVNGGRVSEVLNGEHGA